MSCRETKGSSFGDPEAVKGEFHMIPVRGKYMKKEQSVIMKNCFGLGFGLSDLTHTSPELAKLHMIR